MASRANIRMTVGPGEEWTVEMTWDDDDRNGPSELSIRPTNPKKRPPGGISQTVLRDIDLAGAMRLVRANDQVKAPDLEWEKVGPLLVDLSKDGISDTYLSVLSWAYSAAANKPKPVEKLSELTGKSIPTIKSHLWHASRNGFLERSPGRAGGAITEKAVNGLSELVDQVKNPRLFE